MSSIANVTSVPNNQAASFLNPEAVARETGKQTLNVDDFLHLLTVQLTSQDPMKPMEDTQFISQMASFTSLEQMQTLSKDFAAFSTQQQTVSAQNFLGKIVTVATEAGNITGPVMKVSFDGEAPLLSVNGGDFYLADVISVSSAPTPATSSQASNSTEPASPSATAN
jgi:flagellar basal-body rod modification protein FlgD